MKSRDSLFLVTCLAITAIAIWAYSQFSTYFAGHTGAQDHSAQDDQMLRRERFARAMAEARLRDFSQQVAKTLPPDVHLNYSLKTLSDAIREPASIPLDLSGVAMEKGKKLFAEARYVDAAKAFEKLVKDFPTSPNAIESYFLLGESSYLLKDEKRTIEVADLMVSQYPDHELTGFMLLRLGQINEHNGHPEEAAEIYRVVSKNFKNSALAEQARILQKAVETQ